MINIFLKTERLILRQFTEEDVDNLFELDSDPDVVRHANDWGETTEYEVIKNKILPNLLEYYKIFEGYGYWAAMEKSSDEFIGWFHFRPVFSNPDDIELGYRLRKAAWGKGYATEGSQALIFKGFTELGTQRVTSTALVVNQAAVRVMEKAGLKFEKTFIYEPMNQEAVKYALNRDEFAPNNYFAT